MSFSLSNRALLRGMLAGAVVLTGTACSRSDRTESGRDNSSAQPSISAQSNSPPAETAGPSEKDAAGYRSMERDTTNVPTQLSESPRVTADAADASSVASDTSMSGTPAGADTAAAGYVEMARDTSTLADQDVAMKATIDTSSQPSAEVSVITPDEAADETGDEQVVRPEDRETVAASETRTDEVGAAAIGSDVTGAEAVALVSRAGVRCAVVDPEANEAVRWDMSNTPIALNPCGMGSMVPSKIWTRVE
jgi:hypothetical protein